jgi:hypothetical protein
MTTLTQYVLVYERAMEEAYAIGPFPTREFAEQYARDHHERLQVWRTAQLRPPLAALQYDLAQASVQPPEDKP